MRRFLKEHLLKHANRDWPFLFKAFVIAFVVLCFMHVIAPFMGLPQAQSEAEIAMNQRIVGVGSGDMPHQLETMRGKPAVLVLYASWCPYCRKLVPELAGLIRGGQLQGIAPLMLALDDDQAALSVYLIREHYGDLFVPYRLSGGGAHQLSDRLKSLGGHWGGQIPYTAFFDGEGKLVAEFTGVVDKKRLLQAAALTHHE